MSIKVEFGFNKGDDGLVQFNDISSDVVSVSINRGKDPEQDTFNAASCNITLNNQLRTYDPDYPDSPYQGQVIPTGSVRVFVDSQPVFTGFITDWNFSYSPNGESMADLVAADAFWNLNNQLLNEYEPNEQLSSERVLDVLLRPEVGGSAVWPASARKISPGVATIGDYSVSDGTTALSHLQEVERAEPGRLFIDKEGSLVFRSRNNDLSAPTFQYTRTNLCTNPSFEDNLDGWTGTPFNAFDDLPFFEFERISSPTSGVYSGSFSLLMQNAEAVTEFETEANNSYTVSFYTRGETTGASVSYEILNTSNLDQLANDAIYAQSSEWQRSSISFVATGSSTILKIIVPYLLPDNTAVFIDAVLVEKTPLLDAYFDGDTPPVYNTDDPEAPDYQPERAFETYETDWIGS